MRTLEATEGLLGSLPLHCIETYVYYDRPLVFLAEIASSMRFLVTLVEETPDRERWLLLPVTESRVSMLTTRRMTLREAFLHREFEYVLESVTRQDHSAEVRLLAEINECDLPEPDAFLAAESEEGS